jgi:hypothetical protein
MTVSCMCSYNLEVNGSNKFLRWTHLCKETKKRNSNSSTALYVLVSNGCIICSRENIISNCSRCAGFCSYTVTPWIKVSPRAGEEEISTPQWALWVVKWAQTSSEACSGTLFPLASASVKRMSAPVHYHSQLPYYVGNRCTFFSGLRSIFVFRL